MPGIPSHSHSVPREDKSKALTAGPLASILISAWQIRRIRKGPGCLVLKHVSPRFVSARHHTSTLAILALRSIGRRFVDDDIVARLRRNLSPVDRAALLDDLACAPAWIADIFRQVAATE